jgi:hypothetical protein
MVDYQTPDRVAEERQLADALDDLAARLDGAESIAEECPVLSELFHEARTSGRNPRDGRFVALFDYDEDDGWTCRSVSFLQSGTHYRDHGADLSLSNKPFAWMPVKTFREAQASEIRRQAQARRQTASGIEAQAEEEARRKQMREGSTDE